MLKLSDVMGGAFVALPEDQLPAEMEMSHERPPVVKQEPKVDTGVAVAPWEAARRAQEAEPVASAPVQQKIEVPVVAPAAGVVLPWLKAAQQEALAEAASEPTPPAQPAAATATEVAAPVVQNTLEESLTAIAEIPAPSLVEQTIQTMAEAGNVEGWGPTSPTEEATTCQFRNDTDAADWVIAKGRALSYSTIDRPDPFHVETMYSWIDESKHSHMLNRPITSFRMACRHAIATTVLFYEQDVNNFAALKAQHKADVDAEQKEAEVSQAHQEWKALVEQRKNLIADMDAKVAQARDKWHALRK